MHACVCVFRLPQYKCGGCMTTCRSSFFPPVGSRVGAEVIRLGGKHLNPLSCAACFGICIFETGSQDVKGEPGLELANSPASVSCTLGLQVCGQLPLFFEQNKSMLYVCHISCLASSWMNRKCNILVTKNTINDVQELLLDSWLQTKNWNF